MSIALYLDIETNYAGEISVLGVYGSSIGMVQLVRPQITAEELQRVLPPTGKLYTYNGHCFDLPVIRNRLGVNLREQYECIDLRFACQRVGWKGGLKKVEKQLGVARKLPDVTGMMAPWLWEQYWIENDKKALKMLLDYNREDVMNLRLVRRALKQQAKI